MSQSELPSQDGEPLAASPDFELECLFDDMENPSEVTVFYPEGERTATEWITVGKSNAVSLSEIR